MLKDVSEIELQKGLRMIQIFVNTKIYFVIPANMRTGGPQFIHQIIHHFRNTFKMDAYIYAIPAEHPYPVPSDYQIYNNPLVDKIEDEWQNILIVPEIYLTVKILDDYKSIRKIIWWLSLDNYFINRFINKQRLFYLPIRGLNKIFESFGKASAFDINQIAVNYYKGYNLKNDHLIDKAIINLCSAKHVQSSLEEIGLKAVFYISEFLNEDFFKTEADESKKENIIAYNGVKGINFTKKLVKYASHLKFIPIRNMSKEEFTSLLKRAKVYVDFGNHPGRDRLPREAAWLKCCVITNRRGGARLEDDLSIPEEYKYDDDIENIPMIVKKIESCLFDYPNRVLHFDTYRKNTQAEQKKFLEDVKKIFVKV